MTQRRSDMTMTQKFDEAIAGYFGGSLCYAKTHFKEFGEGNFIGWVIAEDYEQGQELALDC